MHAYLLIAKDEAIKDIEVKKITNSLKANVNSFKSSGIDDVKNISRFTRFKITKPQVVLLKDFDKASTAAVNALLKTLEEPQKNLYFILTASNYYAVPETIRSRCQITKLGNTSEIKQDVIHKIHDFLDKSTSEKLLFLDKIKDRTEAVEFINLLITVVQKDLITSDNPQKYARVLENAQLCLINLEANGNVNLQLTNFVVGIDSKVLL